MFIATLIFSSWSFILDHAEFFPFTALIHSHQLFKSNMHPDVLNSIFLPDNDVRTERLVQQLAFRVVEDLSSKFCPEVLHSTQAVYVFPRSVP